MIDHDSLWPGQLLHEAVHRLCEHAGLVRVGPDLATPAIDPSSFDASLQIVAKQVGVEAHATALPHHRLDSGLRDVAPAILRIDLGDRVFALAVVSGTRRRLKIVGRSGEAREVDPASIRDLVMRTEPSGESADPRLGSQPGARVPEAYARIVELSRARVEGHGQLAKMWELRPSASAPLLRQLAGAGLDRIAVGLGLLYTIRIALLGCSWWILGTGALRGALEPAMLLAWALTLATLVVVSAGADWVEGHLLLAINARYRRKILHGATKLPPRASRAVGAGQLLGRVFETEALDTLAVSAGVSGITSAIDVGFAMALFLVIPGASPLALVLLGWLAWMSIRGVRLYHVQKAWTRARIAMSERVVEGLLGRRTRVVQTSPADRHAADDRSLEHYLELSSRVDGTETSFEVIAARGWLLAALLALAAIAAGQGLAAGPVAAAVGAVLLAFQALSRFATSVHLVAAVVISWRQAELLYRSSGAPEDNGVPEVVAGARFARSRAPAGSPLLQVNGVSFRFAPGRHAIVDAASLTISVGDRVLLSGPSGGGKSTLARLLAGIERPASGGIALRALDLQTLGQDEWARRIAYVPPFGVNHVFSDSFLYNLTPGHWPPTPAQIEEAERVCEELGLGPLLRRMPGHLQQIVGETGWRLSHGEQARLFLARAILQHPELVILDESFGALDPTSIKGTVDCVLRRCPTVVVISHV